MKINIDKTIISLLFILLGIKLLFTYLNVELDWWQRELTPNIEKYNFFNLSENFSKNLEFIIIPLLVFYIVKNYRYLGSFSITIFLIVILFTLNIITSFLTSKSLLDSIEYTIKFSSPICFFLCLIIHKKKYSFDIKGKALKSLIGCIILLIIGLIFFDPSYNHWKNWLPIYFTSLHTHNYILVCIAIGFAFKLYKSKKYISLFLFLIAYFLFLYFGYQIRSALVFYLIFTLAITYATHDLFKILWIKLIIFLPFFLAFYLAFNSSFDLNKYSSGRVTMYQAKIEMLKDYSPSEYLFGRGKGSDFIKTEDWWYAKKNSHNDLLTFLVENGVIYAITFILLIMSLGVFSRKVNIVYISILLGYIGASFLSNGIPLRPIAGYVLFLVLAYIYSELYLEKTELKIPPVNYIKKTNQ